MMTSRGLGVVTSATTTSCPSLIPRAGGEEMVKGEREDGRRKITTLEDSREEGRGRGWRKKELRIKISNEHAHLQASCSGLALWPSLEPPESEEIHT